uniref:NB-ARC domain-containing protein n=1 Tax=Rodentolepis nana TaxID=102285 RepID=A0A0R3T7V5_RODNA
LAAEGLCGPIRFLIDRLPEEHLLHSNRDSKSVLSLLLIRGHGNCGCLEALLQRISPSVLENSSDTTNQIILSVNELLERIKTSAVDRVTGVFKTWITLNYIHLEEEDEIDNESRSRINERLIQRTVGAVIKDCQSIWANPREISISTYLVFQLIIKLFILGRIGLEFLDACHKEVEAAFSIDQPRPLQEVQMQQLERIRARSLTNIFGGMITGIFSIFSLRIAQLRRAFEPVAPLKFLTILSLRRYLLCATRSTTRSFPITTEGFAFHHQLEELNLPLYLHKLVLMQDDIYYR